MSPIGRVECIGKTVDFSVSGGVVIESLIASKERAKVTVDGQDAMNILLAAVAKATQGYRYRPFHLTIMPDENGGTKVDNVTNKIYSEQIPTRDKLVVVGGIVISPKIRYIS